MKVCFTHATVVTVNENFDVIENGQVEITDEMITYVGSERSGKQKFDQVIDCKGNLLMPGFINTHCHAAMTLFRNAADDVEFETWWHKNILPKEKRLTATDLEKGLTLAVQEMLSGGITTFFDCYFGQDKTVEVCHKFGIRAGVGFGAVWGSDAVTLESLEKEYDFLSHQKNIIPFLYAHSTYSCDEYQFSTLLKMAKKHQLVFSTHASETLSEVGECHSRYGVTPIGLLENYGMLDIPCVLAHGVHCDKDDMNILKKYLVTIAHNPASNLKLGSGIAPVASYLHHGISVSLGTDGAASNNALDMFREMYLATTLQSGILNNPQAVSVRQVIEMATVNGAKAFGLNNLGRLKKGYLADMIVLNIHTPNMQPYNNLVSGIVYSCNRENVLLTMVDGQVVYQAKNGEENLF